MSRLCKLITRATAVSFLAVVVYILSYAPFLRCSAPADPVSGSFYYRSPVLYRPVEWLTLKTGTDSPLLSWARLCGARDAAELQTWFFAHGIDDPTDLHVNWASSQ